MKVIKSCCGIIFFYRGYQHYAKKQLQRLCSKLKFRKQYILNSSQNESPIFLMFFFQHFSSLSDFNECNNGADNQCSTNAKCLNTWYPGANSATPGYHCVCNPGWSGNGITCNSKEYTTISFSLILTKETFSPHNNGLMEQMIIILTVLKMF